MLVQCPNCKSLFDLPQASFTVSKFRCSTCQHVWENQHKILSIGQHKPNHIFNWILLWSAMGVIAVSLYIGYPCLDVFLADLKTKFYSNNVAPFIFNESDEKGTISSEGIPHISEMSTAFKVNEVDEREDQKDELSDLSNSHFPSSDSEKTA
ncbi:zinc-ribbon domain-containing protein [Candidatus Odyssella acanthamoebae]|uniref:Zinc finger/thioredoxin putative domain-containing protein n=1 Tax=Candidatus Odyssella acanthamoebae TaxID=91604 RepID=A0A077AUP0_9PROT|nr:zinc-ribbon domain-containing protein [Candidatus Paracaedibacter acanthamoebae]AIK96116.1 hypothetical protein ID47_04210 [Candidatus Paracaedibacter acanthamoebae]